MPTYEYRCRQCGETLEVVQSFTDDPLTECPACQGELKKVFAAPSISFKGDGFYKTDSRSPAKAGSSASTDTDGGGSGSSDSSGDSSGDSSSSSSTGSSDEKGATPKKDAKAASSSSS